MEASPRYIQVEIHFATVLSKNARVVQVQPWALRSDVETTVGVSCPAVETLVPLVVGVLIGSVLNTVVALSVEPVLRLKHLRQATSSQIVVGDVNN